LLTRVLIEEVRADAKQEVWRTNDEGVALTLKLTKAGRGERPRSARRAP
jgi:hypothetical protein